MFNLFVTEFDVLVTPQSGLLYRRPWCCNFLLKMASSYSASWTSRPGCHAYLREAFQGAVNAAPTAYRDSPVTGEIFESPADVEERFTDLSLSFRL